MKIAHNTIHMGNSQSEYATNFNISNDPQREFEVRIIHGQAKKYKLQADKLERLIKAFYPRSTIVKQESAELSRSFEVIANNALLHSKTAGQHFVKDPKAFMGNLRNVVEGSPEEPYTSQ